MSGLTDIHHHVLYGLDDGPKTYEEMAAMLRVAHENGVTTLIATPHVTPGVDAFQYELMMERLKEAQAYCEAMGFPLKVLPGAEILYTPAIINALMDRKLPTLAGTQYVLVEFSPNLKYGEVETAVKKLIRFGYRPILAHVERYRCLRRRGRLAQLREKYKVYYQINCNSLLGNGGLRVKRFARYALEEGQLDYVASDAHDVQARKCRMQEAFRFLCKHKDQRFANRCMRTSMSE